jgi:hypothetical protein
MMKKDQEGKQSKRKMTLKKTIAVASIAASLGTSLGVVVEDVLAADGAAGSTPQVSVHKSPAVGEFKFKNQAAEKLGADQHKITDANQQGTVVQNKKLVADTVKSSATQKLNANQIKGGTTGAPTK